MDMPWGPEMTLVSACCWLISSQSKGFKLSRSPCTSTALLPVPGEEACPAFEILLSPCHLSMHEGLADREPCASYKTFQLNKHKVSCKATEKKQMSDRCYHAEFQKRICAMWKKKKKKQNWQSSDSHWTMQNLGKEYFSTGKDYKTISDSLNTRYFKTYSFTTQWIWWSC